MTCDIYDYDLPKKAMCEHTALCSFTGCNCNYICHCWIAYCCDDAGDVDDVDYAEMMMLMMMMMTTITNMFMAIKGDVIQIMSATMIIIANVLQ